jgi:hypothetical protein
MADTITPPGKARVMTCPECKGAGRKDCIECRYAARETYRYLRPD